MEEKKQKHPNIAAYIIVFVLTFILSVFSSYSIVSNNPNLIIKLTKTFNISNNSLDNNNSVVSNVPSETTDPVSAKQYVYGVPVAESDPVPNSYFKDSLFVGDSLTTGFKSYTLISFNNIIARNGLKIEDVMTTEYFETENGNITMIDAMKSYDVSHIYIMVGANSVSYASVENIIGEYSKILDAVKKDHPTSNIYVQSILPVTSYYEAQNPNHNNEKIDKINTELLNLCKEKEVHYLNVAEIFKDESGAMYEYISPGDGLHISKNSYRIWIDYLKTHTV